MQQQARKVLRERKNVVVVEYTELRESAQYYLILRRKINPRGCLTVQSQWDWDGVLVRVLD